MELISNFLNLASLKIHLVLQGFCRTAKTFTYTLILSSQIPHILMNILSGNMEPRQAWHSCLCVSCRRSPVHRLYRLLCADDAGASGISLLHESFHEVNLLIL